MRTELKQLLIEFIKQKEIVASWGFSKLRINKKSFSFTVSAFRYKGKVRIICTKKSYTIEFGNIKKYNQKIDDVISFIDKMIETSFNYTEEVLAWIEGQTCKTQEDIDIKTI